VIDLRTLQLLAASEERRLAPRRCERPGCPGATRERKPFCSEHVTEHPHVHQLLATIADREAEIADIERLGSYRGMKAVRADGTVLGDVLAHLRANGQRTVERLARETALPLVVVEAVAMWLRRQRLASLGATSRGNTTLKLAS
jgi:hypothetical protein